MVFGTGVPVRNTKVIQCLFDLQPVCEYAMKEQSMRAKIKIHNIFPFLSDSRPSIGDLYSIGHAGHAKSIAAALQKWLRCFDARFVLFPKTRKVAKRKINAGTLYRKN